MTDAMKVGGDSHHPPPEAVGLLRRRPLVRPHALLSRTRRHTPDGGLRASVAEAVLRRVLSRMGSDRLEIVSPDGRRAVYGSPRSQTLIAGAGPLEASMTVHDRRAWTAVLSEGSIGLGRGYLEGWWSSAEPTTVVQVLIRNLDPLDELRNRFDQATGRIGDQIRRLGRRPDRARNREDISSHYDLGNEFFALFLDETMTYSSGVFEGPATSLADASRAKYDRLLAKLGVTADHHVLEIGTGWGGFALRAAATTGCRVTTTTISLEQQREAQARVEQADLADRITVLDADWRDLEGAYDRVVSIEMIEAVDWRHYRDYFAAIDRCLRPDGLAGIQAICVPDRRWRRTKNTEDFIRRFVFPGGYLPSVGAINAAVTRATRLQLTDLDDISAHYAETLLRWRQRFEHRLDDVRRLGLDERFVRLWRFYLAYCEAAFRERHCTSHQLVLTGSQWRPNGLEPRPA
jgi:cyclopropane-fatty-acyl-phospholipid synthase